MRDPSGHIIAGLRIARSEALGEFDDSTLTTLEAMEPVLTAALYTALRDDAMLTMRASLTEREQEVLQWIINGVPNKVICRRLDLALPTVKCHVKNVLRKLGATSRADLIAKVYGACLRL